MDSKLCCLICYGEADELNPLVYRADATHGCRQHVVHKSCYEEWRRMKDTDEYVCVMCSAPFQYETFHANEAIRAMSMSEIADPMIQTLYHEMLAYYERTKMVCPFSEQDVLRVVKQYFTQ